MSPNYHYRMGEKVLYHNGSAPEVYYVRSITHPFPHPTRLGLATSIDGKPTIDTTVKDVRPLLPRNEDQDMQVLLHRVVEHCIWYANGHAPKGSIQERAALLTSWMACNGGDSTWRLMSYYGDRLEAQIAQVLHAKAYPWMKLLGDNCLHCKVDGKDIVKHMGNNAYKVLHSCDNDKQAQEVFTAWRNEIAT